MAPPRSRCISQETKNIEISKISRLAMQQLDKVLKPYYPLDRLPNRNVFHDIDLVNQETEDKSFTIMGTIVFATEKLKAWETMISSTYQDRINFLANLAQTSATAPGVTPQDPATLLQLTLPHDPPNHPANPTDSPTPDSEGNVTVKEEYLRRLELENHVYRRHLAHFEHLIHEKVGNTINELAEVLRDNGIFGGTQKAGDFENAIDPAAETGANGWGGNREGVFDIMDDDSDDGHVGPPRVGPPENGPEKSDSEKIVIKKEEEDGKETFGGFGRGLIQRSREWNGESAIDGGVTNIVDLTEDVGERFRGMSVSTVGPDVEQNLGGPTENVQKSAQATGENSVGPAALKQQGNSTWAVSNAPMRAGLANKRSPTTAKNGVRSAKANWRRVQPKGISNTHAATINVNAGPVAFGQQMMPMATLRGTPQATIESRAPIHTGSPQKLPTGVLENIPRAIISTAADSGMVREQKVPPMGVFKPPKMSKKRKVETVNEEEEEFTPMQKKLMR